MRLKNKILYIIYHKLIEFILTKMNNKVVIENSIKKRNQIKIILILQDN